MSANQQAKSAKHTPKRYTQKRYTHEELHGQYVIMPAYAFQALDQALTIVNNDLLCDDGECVDYKKNPRQARVHRLLSVAALMPYGIDFNRKVMAMLSVNFPEVDADVYPSSGLRVVQGGLS